MIQELPYDYEISVENMIPVEQEHQINGYYLTTGQFYKPNSNSTKPVDMFILEHENATQIFRMNDGKWILEITDIDTIYLFSDNLEELSKKGNTDPYHL
jgi:hypothetical protein